MRICPGTARQVAALFISAVFVVGVVAGIIAAELVEHPLESGVDFKVTATQLAHAFAINDVAAGEKYDGKLIEVCGIVEDCTTDDLNRRIVELRGSNAASSFMNVKCFFPNTSVVQVCAIRPRDLVSVIGKCIGEGVDVLITDCKLK